MCIRDSDKATSLTYLALPHTKQFADLIKNLPAFIRHLYLQDTEYELPSAQVGKNLESLGLPGYVKSLDLAQYPNLSNLNADGSLLRYSTVNNYRQINYNGWGHITLTSPSHPESIEWFENGDTIDLSSEAVIDGIETVFLWVNAKYGIEAVSYTHLDVYKRQVLEKSGHYDETQALFNELSETIGVLQFIRSGRVAITKSKVERLSDMLADMERKLQEKQQ